MNKRAPFYGRKSLCYGAILFGGFFSLRKLRHYVRLGLGIKVDLISSIEPRSEEKGIGLSWWLPFPKNDEASPSFSFWAVSSVGTDSPPRLPPAPTPLAESALLLNSLSQILPSLKGLLLRLK